MHFARPWTQASEPAMADFRGFALASSFKDTTGAAVEVLLQFVSPIGSKSEWRYCVTSECPFRCKCPRGAVCSVFHP